jgi:hypothetical protein
MNLTVEIPDDIAGRLSAGGGDLSRRAREAFLAEEYKHERLTKSELQQLLGIRTGSELADFLKAHDIGIEDMGTGRGAFNAEKAQAAGARIRELRKGVRLDLQGMSIRDLAHVGHKY